MCSGITAYLAQRSSLMPARYFVALRSRRSWIYFRCRPKVDHDLVTPAWPCQQCLSDRAGLPATALVTPLPRNGDLSPSRAVFTGTSRSTWTEESCHTTKPPSRCFGFNSHIPRESRFSRPMILILDIRLFKSLPNLKLQKQRVRARAQRSRSTLLISSPRRFAGAAFTSSNKCG